MLSKQYMIHNFDMSVFDLDLDLAWPYPFIIHHWLVDEEKKSAHVTIGVGIVFFTPSCLVPVPMF